MSNDIPAAWGSDSFSTHVSPSDDLWKELEMYAQLFAETDE